MILLGKSLGFHVSHGLCLVYGPRVFNNEIEGSYPEYVLPGVCILRAGRGQCPVCGHPTGDCTGDTAPPRQIIGESFVKDGQAPGADVLVLEDLFDMVNITPRTQTKVLVARKGSYITKEKAIQYGLISP